MQTLIVRIPFLLGVSCVLLLVISLLYRSLVQPNWLPAPGEPYGVADVLEGLLWFAVLGLSVACLALSVVLALPSRFRDMRGAIRMLAIGIGVPLAAYLIYPHLPLVRLGGA
ncbi:hypothetical protein [Cognatiluteimonas lumbrici]|uniref:hypothetical protein n=1 Tax=Cognatiluteimonas lumbrici TaxID=2559601 RepID=UPI001C6FD577|nr:hypothetical protein [Luteimonas lumbrici]